MPIVDFYLLVVCRNISLRISNYCVVLSKVVTLHELYYPSSACFKSRLVGMSQGYRLYLFETNMLAFDTMLTNPVIHLVFNLWAEPLPASSFLSLNALVGPSLDILAGYPEFTTDFGNCFLLLVKHPDSFHFLFNFIIFVWTSTIQFHFLLGLLFIWHVDLLVLFVHFFNHFRVSFILAFIFDFYLCLACHQCVLLRSL